MNSFSNILYKDNEHMCKIQMKVQYFQGGKSGPDNFSAGSESGWTARMCLNTCAAYRAMDKKIFL